jgi:hypothetical protein
MRKWTLYVARRVTDYLQYEVEVEAETQEAAEGEAIRILENAEDTDVYYVRTVPGEAHEYEVYDNRVEV